MEPTSFDIAYLQAGEGVLLGGCNKCLGYGIGLTLFRVVVRQTESRD